MYVMRLITISDFLNIVDGKEDLTDPVRKKWDSLRGSYVRTLKRGTRVSSVTATIIESKFKHFASMSFLGDDLAVLGGTRPMQTRRKRSDAAIDVVRIRLNDVDPLSTSPTQLIPTQIESNAPIDFYACLHNRLNEMHPNKRIRTQKKIMQILDDEDTN